MCDMTYDEAGGYSNTAVLLISVENVRIWNLGAISHSTGVLCPVVVLTGLFNAKGTTHSAKCTVFMFVISIKILKGGNTKWLKVRKSELSLKLMTIS